MLARALEVFALEPDVALVSTKRLTINEHGHLQKVNEQLDSSCLISGGNAITGCLLQLYNWIGEPSAVMFPSLLQGSGFDPSFYHLGDLEYWFRIMSNGNYVYLDEPLCSFRSHQGNTTNKNMKSLLFALDMLRLGRMYRKYIIEAGMDEDDYVSKRWNLVQILSIVLLRKKE